MVDCGASNQTTNRFVCPNDRQLALRAKLRTGWSVKTGSLGTYPSQKVNQSLGPEEQAAIIDVIKRAEELDIIEQERVGRLMERLENMRRNTLGRTPTQCLLCGDSFGMLGAQKVLCRDCRRFVCQKCAIEASDIGKTNKNYCLCLICAETREIWKKSGAWFFKSLPKYVLPSEKFGHAFNNKTTRRTTKCFYRDDDSSSDEDRRLLWSRSNLRETNSETFKDLTNCSSQDNLTNITYNRYLTTSDLQVSKDFDSIKSFGTVSPTTLSMDSKSNQDIDENNGGSNGGNCGFSGKDMKESSESGRSLSEWNCRNDERISPSTSSGTSSIFKSGIDNYHHKSSDSQMGSIELSLMYDPLTSTLHCTVYRAKNLIPMDINGLSDPFCKLNILPNAKPSRRLRTKTIHKTRNPEFNENLTFYDISEDDLAQKSLYIIVVDDDKYGHDYMGETRINLAKLKQQNTIYVATPLEKLRDEQRGPIPTPELNEWFDDLWSRGQILLSLCYSTKRRALLVTVCRCTNLLPMDNNGYSDPFVKLQLRPDPYHRKHKTTIKWKNLNPIYNEEFAFDTRPTELTTQSLYITVYDKDYGKSNDYLGGLIIGGTQSKGARLKHWLDMIRYPDHRHEAWHNLTEDVLD